MISDATRQAAIEALEFERDYELSQATMYADGSPNHKKHVARAQRCDDAYTELRQPAAPPAEYEPVPNGTYNNIAIADNRLYLRISYKAATVYLPDTWRLMRPRKQAD